MGSTLTTAELDSPPLQSFLSGVKARLAVVRAMLEARSAEEKPDSNAVVAIGAVELQTFIADAADLHLTGASKKLLVTWAAAALIDTLVPLFPLGWFALLGWVIRPALRQVMYWLSDGAIEFFYRAQKTATAKVSEAP